jgi:Protein of unknown function (DUF2281)
MIAGRFEESGKLIFEIELVRVNKIMKYLKQKIAENLERLPEGELQEVLDFVDFLVWRNSKRKETRAIALLLQTTRNCSKFIRRTERIIF